MKFGAFYYVKLTKLKLHPPYFHIDKYGIFQLRINHKWSLHVNWKIAGCSTHVYPRKLSVSLEAIVAHTHCHWSSSWHYCNSSQAPNFSISSTCSLSMSPILDQVEYSVAVKGIHIEGTHITKDGDNEIHPCGSVCCCFSISYTPFLPSCPFCQL